MTENKRYTTRKAVATRYRVHEQTVLRWEKSGALPAPIRIGNKILHDLDALDAWDEASKVGSA
jgi:predicted site-specific integrase-resolvase